MTSQTPRRTVLAAGLFLVSAGFALAAELPDLRFQDAGKQDGPPAASAKPVWATTTEHRVDTMTQFPDPAERRQCGVGACHAFSSISILEAAYFRAHGERVTLSEADVFVRRTVLSKRLYDEFCATGKCELSEGNDVAGDIQFALDNGVATSLNYKDFSERYLRYRKAEQATLAGLEREYQKMSWLEKLLYDPRAHWAELQQQPRAKRILSDLLTGRDPKLDAERAQIKKKLAGFKLKSQSFDYLGEKAKRTSPADCAKNASKQKAAIIGELKAQRPVSVSMSLVGLKEWRSEKDKDDANHAFTIVAYRDEPKEGLRFETRNSWGGDNPEVPETKLCRIYSVVTVRTPVDK
ncbi:MAG: hypothetical protein HY077_00180 [Elusimicrobia bacterium]|nr:hypothetical protein [Elusimicrobiota bacterium]